MLIDWFTVVAQVLNFLILVWLLKRFLYRPILDSISAREKGISTLMSDAAAKRAAALSEREEFQRKNEEFDQQRAELLSKSSDEAQTERQRLLEQARKEVAGLRDRMQADLRSEQQTLSSEITRKVQTEVFALTRKTLADLATASLESAMTEVFIGRLKVLAGPDKALLESALKAAASGSFVLRSAFDLPNAQRASIAAAVSEAFGSGTQLRFETAQDLVAGLELTVGGQKLTWSVSDYLDTLQGSIGKLLAPAPTAAVPSLPTVPPTARLAIAG
jgi:F-type H+-transporting ATPase subunit b